MLMGTLVPMFPQSSIVFGGLAQDDAKHRWLAMGSALSGEAKLPLEGEAIAAYGTATMVAFKILAACLQRSGAIERGEFAEALRIFTEDAESEIDRMPLAILHDLRIAMMDWNARPYPHGYGASARSAPVHEEAVRKQNA